MVDLASRAADQDRHAAGSSRPIRHLPDGRGGLAAAGFVGILALFNGLRAPPAATVSYDRRPLWNRRGGGPPGLSSRPTLRTAGHSEAGIAWRLDINARNLDAGKQYGKCRVKGRKRHIIVESQGLLMHVLVDTGDARDLDNCFVVMATSFGLYPFLLKLYADGDYQRPEFQAGLEKAIPGEHRIVRRIGRAKAFVALPRRWIVERTFAWFNRCRRLAKDWECLNAKALTFVKLASIRRMIRRLCNPS